MNYADLKLTIKDISMRTDIDTSIPRLIAFGQKTLERGIKDRRERNITLRLPAMLNTPEPLDAPVNATFTAGAGTLNAGAYRYRVSAIDIFGGETLASTETSLTLVATGGVNVNWTKVDGAVGYKVYGRTAGAEQLIATVGDVATYLDGGNIAPAGAISTKNTTCLLLEDANTIAVPEDYIELSYLGLIDGDTVLPAMDKYTAKKNNEIGFTKGTTNKGEPYVFDRKGDSFVLDKYADKDYTINMAYYRHLPALSETNRTNWWSLNAEEALIYAALVSAIPTHFYDDPRGEVWRDKLIEEMEKLDRESKREKVGGIRARGNLINTTPYLGG